MWFHQWSLANHGPCNVPWLLCSHKVEAVGRANAFKEKDGFTSTTGAKVTSINKKIELSKKKITLGTKVVNEKVKEMEKKFQTSDKTK